jgi:PAS domain S-box-containing protein
MKKSSLHLRIMDRKIRWILAFSLVAFILFLLVLSEQTKKQEASRQLVDHTNFVIKKIDTLGLIFAEAEAATRSYLVVHSPDWERQIYFLHGLINIHIESLTQLTKDNPVQQNNVIELQRLCTEKERFQKKLIDGTTPPDSIAAKIRPEGEGPLLSHSVKQLLKTTRDIEEALLSNRMAQNEASYRTSIYIAFGGGIFALLLVLAILSQLNFDINLRKKAEGHLAESEEKYRSLIENAGAVMYTTDVKGNITFANSKVAELTGYSMEELSNKHFAFLIDPDWRTSVNEFYTKQFLQQETATYLEFKIRTKSGKEKWVEQSAHLLMEDDEIRGFQCMVKDITEKKQVEQELDQSEKMRTENEYRLNAILDNSTALIYIKDLEGRYVMVNKRFKTFFGLSDEMVIGQTDYDFNEKKLADYFKHTDERVIQTLRPLETEELIDTPWGKRNLLLQKFPLLTKDGVLLGVSGIATDVTDKTELQKQTVAALQKAESAQQIQEQFLANMSHEIRTPMNGIQGMTRLLLETKLTEEQKRFTSIISRSLNSLVVIVNNVLDFSNLRAGKLVLDSFVFDLSDLLAEMKKYFEHALVNKKLTFELVTEKEVPKLVKGDSFRLKQILTNLIGNAVKFTNEGGIQLHLSVKTRSEKEVCILFVLSDTGIGIPKDKQQIVFESFAQASKHISSGYGGAGLGLTISKGLIEIQGGNISVESEPGKGSVFSFCIPFGLAEKQDTEELHNDYTAVLNGKKLLVVEDNPVNQRLIEFVLKKVNVSTDLAANGKEAIALCEKNPGYDLVIMDLQMPVMDGYEATEYIRNILKLDMPIIAMTATALKEDQEKSIAVGMNDFMIKPFDFNDLYARLVRLLYQVDIGQEEMAATATEKHADYDLSLLEELEDPVSMHEVLSIFFESVPQEIEQLQRVVKENNQPELYRLAHKLKSAVGTIQSVRMTELLKAIEKNAASGENSAQSSEMVNEVVSLFRSIEAPLRNELERLRKEAGTQS